MSAETPVALGVYGTLLDPQVRDIVLGPTTARAAILAGWERLFVAGTAYPGIRPRDGSAIDVLVLIGLGSDALARADYFEGEEYDRQTLPVRFADDGSAGKAAFYVPRSAVCLSPDAWHYDAAWRYRYLTAFLAEARAMFASDKISPLE